MLSPRLDQPLRFGEPATLEKNDPQKADRVGMIGRNLQDISPYCLGLDQLAAPMQRDRIFQISSGFRAGSGSGAPAWAAFEIAEPIGAADVEALIQRRALPRRRGRRNRSANASTVIHTTSRRDSPDFS